eukprot:m.38035 g.38035  ORF g.38035 m.38035 type:complete len:232 (-) comp16395_c0_seq1:23-718(-)
MPDAKNYGGGFAAFNDQFPFLCGPDISMRNMVPLPHLVTPFIFLGSRAFDPTLAALKMLGVTHVVTHGTEQTKETNLFADESVVQQQLVHHRHPQSEPQRQPQPQPQSQPSGPTPFQSIFNRDLPTENDIVYLRCELVDDNDQEMREAFLAAATFISEARDNGGRVLVQVHGRSRSAAIIIAYLIRAEQMSYFGAYERVLSCAPAIDGTLIYADQLRQLEGLALKHTEASD